MKKTSSLLTAALVLISCVGIEDNAMTLHYDRPAGYFEEALPIGNGRIGAMVYGGTHEERLSLNDITLWTGEPDRHGEHHDFSAIETLTPWGEASASVQEVRKALDAEDYALADRLQKKTQGHYSERYQPLGSLHIRHPEGNITEYRRALDISEALAEVSYRRDGKSFRAQYIASAPDSVIAVHLASEEPLDVVLYLTSQLPHRTAAEDGMMVSDGYAAWHSYPGYFAIDEHALYDPERGTRFRTVVSCPDAVSKGDSLHVSGVNETVIIISSSTSFAGFDRNPATEGREYRASALANAEKAAAMDWKTLRKRQRDDYKELFDRVDIGLGQSDEHVRALPTDIQLLRYADGETNPELEALYFQYGRYLLISSSRTEGVPANLQGLWNEGIDPPWSCNYTTNINLEENYWAAEAAALPEMHEVLLGFIRNLSETGTVTARNYFGIDRGWCLGHNSDIWAMTCPVGLGTGDPSWANWAFGGAWLSTHIWEHWLYGRDMDALRRDYPALKGAAQFCIDYLVEKDGELVPLPSTSPENKYITPEGYVGSTLYGSTADVSIIRECLTDAALAAGIVGDTAFADEVAAVLPRLRDYRIGSDGTLQEWYHDWEDRDPYHRHQSHLFGVYPGHQITSGSEFAQAAAKTLHVKGFETTGWSCGWRVNLYARLGDGENAYRMYRRLLRYVSPDGYTGADARRGGGTYPNLFDAHSPFQIDGNFGGCAGVIEMLVNSSPDGVVPLPALPAAWPDGHIKGIRTRTGQIADLVWENGKIKRFRLRD